MALAPVVTCFITSSFNNVSTDLNWSFREHHHPPPSNSTGCTKAPLRQFGGAWGPAGSLLGTGVGLGAKPRRSQGRGCGELPSTRVNFPHPSPGFLISSSLLLCR